MRDAPAMWPGRVPDVPVLTWWQMKNMWRVPRIRSYGLVLLVLAVLLGIVQTVGGQTSLLDAWIGPFWLLVLYLVLVLVAQLVLTFLAVGRKPYGLMVSADRNAMLMLRRHRRKGQLTFEPHNHTVRIVGKGQGIGLREAFFPALLQLVEEHEGAQVKIRAENQKVFRIYEAELSERNIQFTVKNRDKSKPIIIFPAAD